jgi:hypothetical protein
MNASPDFLCARESTPFAGNEQYVAIELGDVQNDKSAGRWSNNLDLTALIDYLCLADAVPAPNKVIRC